MKDTRALSPDILGDKSGIAGSGAGCVAFVVSFECCLGKVAEVRLMPRARLAIQGGVWQRQREEYRD